MTMKRYGTVKTKRLLITSMTDDELQRVMENEQDEHMRGAYGEMLALCLEHPEERLWATAWRIRLRSGVGIGDLCFKGAPKDGEVELGYGIDEPYRRQGYCTEAVKAMTEWALGQEGVWFVMAETEPGNVPSQRLLNRLGFVPAGEGEEGPRFEKVRPETQWMPIYMCIGMSVGLCFGTALDNLALGMCLGVGAGAAVGSALDFTLKKQRARAISDHEALKARRFEEAKGGHGALAVVAALFRDGGRFMICRRPMNKARGGLWEFPGGKVEPGETPQAALARECREELAIGIDVGEKYMELYHRYPDINVRLTLFEARIASGEPQKLEHSDIRWIAPGEIPEYDFCPADKEILAKLAGEQA